MKLPRLNDRVHVLPAGSDRRLFSRVEELRQGDTVVIAPPSDSGIVVQLEVGENVALEWTSLRGLVRGDGFVSERAIDPMPAVVVRLDTSHIAQRREHVRVEMVLGIQLTQTSAVPVNCHTIDVSGGGMRAFVPLELVAGEIVAVTMTLPDQDPVDLDAEVIRGTEQAGYAFRFAAVEAKDRERLTRFVFAAHRREFAALRRSA